MIDENDEQNSLYTFYLRFIKLISKLLYSGDVWGESHPGSSYFKSRQTGLPVRFRSDIQQVILPIINIYLCMAIHGAGVR